MARFSSMSTSTTFSDAETGDLGALDHRGMGFARGVDPQRPGAGQPGGTGGVDRKRGGLFPGADQRSTGWRSKRCPGSRREIPSGSPINFPSQAMTFSSSSVAAGLVCHSMALTPRPADSISPRMDGPLLLAGKVGEKAGVVPVGHAGQDVALEILEDGFHGLALFGGRVGNQGLDVAGPAAWTSPGNGRRDPDSRRSSRRPRGRGGGILHCSWLSPGWFWPWNHGKVAETTEMW